MDNIYREEFMEHYKNPSNKGRLSAPTVEVLERNPLCGDVVKLQLKIAGGRIADIKFDGPACAVSIASSSILTDFVKGKSLSEIKELSKEDVLGMIKVDLTTSRVKCATLVFDALAAAIEKYEKR